MRRTLLIMGAMIGLVNAAHADVTPFCFDQFLLYLTYLEPITSQSVGSAVVTFKIGEKPCFFNAGETEWESGVRPDENTVFELASVTKVFTTTILGEHFWEGLDVKSPVNPHLPQGYDLTPKEQSVTFQQLATFTGGFWWSDPPDFTKGQPFSQDDFVNEVNLLVPDDEIPGVKNLPTDVHYSNGSVGFLGQILMHMDSAKRQQYPFDANGFSTWIADNLTGPLNMPNTRVHPGGTVAKGYSLCKGTKCKSPFTPQTPFDWVPWGAAGALRSTTADMLNFLEANICARHILDPPIASNPPCSGLPGVVLLGMATATDPNTYDPPGSLTDQTIYIGGCGSRKEQAWAWVYVAPPDPNPNNDTPILYKGGGHPGFASWIAFSPDKKYGLVILLNTRGIGGLNGAASDMIRHTH